MLTEMVLMEPTLQQAMQSLQPLERLSDLRRLNVGQLRQIAELVVNQHRTLSQNATEAPSEVLADATEAVVKK